MDIQRQTEPLHLPNVPADALAFDVEMANSFSRDRPPVICMIGLESYDPKARTVSSTIASIGRREEEEALVHWFLDELEAFHDQRGGGRLLTFSGSDNDLPWMRERLHRYAVEPDRAAVLERFAHVDLREEFRKRTQNNRISLKRLEELFGIERAADLSSKKVSYLLTDVITGRKPGPIPEKVHHYLHEDVHHLLVILNRWHAQSLDDHNLTEYEYLNQLLSLQRLATRLSRPGRRRVDSRDRQALERFAQRLDKAIRRALGELSFERFALPELPTLRSRQQDVERVVKKHLALADIELRDNEGGYRLWRQLDKPKGTLAIVRRNGRVLMIRRADHLERAPGYWGLPGGVLEDGESPQEGAVRELHEELGLHGTAEQLLGTKPSMNKAFELFWVEVGVEDARELAPDAREVAEARWVSPDELKELHPLVPGAVEGFQEFLGSDWARAARHAATGPHGAAPGATTAGRKGAGH